MMANTGTTNEKNTASSSCWGVLIGPLWASSCVLSLMVVVDWAVVNNL